MRELDQSAERPPAGGFGSPINRPPPEPTKAEREAERIAELNKAFKQAPLGGLPERKPK